MSKPARAQVRPLHLLCLLFQDWRKSQKMNRIRLTKIPCCRLLWHPRESWCNKSPRNWKDSIVYLRTSLTVATLSEVTKPSTICKESQKKVQILSFQLRAECLILSKKTLLISDIWRYLLWMKLINSWIRVLTRSKCKQFWNTSQNKEGLACFQQQCLRN